MLQISLLAFLVHLTVIVNLMNYAEFLVPMFVFSQGAVRHTPCSHCLLELQKTLLDGCISQLIVIKDISCGLAISRYMVESFLIFSVIGS